MTYSATAHRLLLSAPSDVAEQDVAVATQTVGRWNALYGTGFGAVVVPTNWDLHAAATYGDRPQAAINSQLVDNADILIAMFWHRLGSPTGEAESGTLEEIDRAHRLGAYVGILRCTRTVAPSEIDADQFGRLEAFYHEVGSRALLLEYNDDASLARHVDAILHAAVASGRASRETAIQATAVADEKRADVWPRMESHGFPSPSYRLVLANTGSEPALRVSYRLEAESDADRDRLPRGIGSEPSVESLAPHGEIRFPIGIYLGTASQFRCVVEWTDSAGEHANVATLSVF